MPGMAETNGRRASSFREALPVWLVTRLAVLVVGYIGVMAVGFPVAPPWTASDVAAFNPLARWDTGW